MSVSRVVATDLDVAMQDFLTHKRAIRSRNREDRESFLKDPVSFDKIQDPVFWVDRLWSRDTIESMIRIARSNGKWYILHPHNSSRKISLEEPLIDASCCIDLIKETFDTVAEVGFDDGVEASRVSQPVPPRLSFPVNLTDHSDGQLILTNILSEAKATGWANTYGYGKKSNWISSQIDKWYSKEHGGFLSW